MQCIFRHAVQSRPIRFPDLFPIASRGEKEIVLPKQSVLSFSARTLGSRLALGSGQVVLHFFGSLTRQGPFSPNKKNENAR